ncbi:MAG: 4Fe-4S dicluster domain-containing protein, partial [Myxococcales bacterium]|nr:4Fe-4S dicluster domain-containing protein [Myxococcales bacterium]
FKCTLCYDRQREGLEPACAKACPTDSITFGAIDELRARARRRLGELHAQGIGDARLYGDTAASQPGTEGLHAFFLIVGEPELYNLPPDPIVPTRAGRTAWLSAGLAAAALGALAASASWLAGRAR